MAWTIELTPEANAQLKKLGSVEAQRILKFLFERLQNREDPRQIGESLKGNLREFWRYRIGDYRLLCHLHDEQLLVLVVQIAHRREVYK